MLRYHVENANINHDDLDDDNLYSEHFKSPKILQCYDTNRLESERYKLTFRKKSNTAQLGKVLSGESTERKDSFSQANEYQDQDQEELVKNRNVTNSIPNTILKAIRIKCKQASPPSADLRNNQVTTEKQRFNEVNQSNQVVLPHLKIKSYHHNKIINNQNAENIVISLENQSIQDNDAIKTPQMQETSADFFQLQSYYQKKYNNNDRMPKSFQQGREVFSHLNSLSNNGKQLQNTNSLITDFDVTDDPFKLQTNKRRSSSFFSSPQKQKKNIPLFQNQHSLQMNNSNQIQIVSQKKTKQPYLSNNDLQPWEDQQNFNETNFFQIVKERTDKSIRNQYKYSESESSQDEREFGQDNKQIN